ncbi:DUF317 domain-containing protein [Streptomyces sp. 4N509B]|uniref:DUF317 domain-containing protein n=1 Tax=Streptomyces sp. 4N509B TaxID=3457413 RepID=UPI003FD30C97
MTFPEGGAGYRDVVPRYLAGPGSNLRSVTEPLELGGWWSFTDHRDTLRYLSPEQDRCVAYLPEEHLETPPHSDELHRLWHVWGRDATAGPARWHATFTIRCPVELIAAATTALTLPEADEDHEDTERQPAAGDQQAAAVLIEAGWRSRSTHRGVRYTAPGGQATLLRRAIPEFVEDWQRSHLVAWRAAVAVDVDEPVLWRAEFTADVPRALLAAFCGALADPTPLPRRDRDLDDTTRPYLHLT